MLCCRRLLWKNYTISLLPVPEEDQEALKHPHRKSASL
jgi:hypothetical protein